MSESQIKVIKKLGKLFNDLITEFLIDLKSIDCGINDYMNKTVNIADGDQLEKIIQKWERRLNNGS
ncbi:MAG: hypothetical protein KAX33_10150 [Candidatus Lokiarchaeota archaeon]|nr:hypothetical protein [Candidatus Lokiarchaeota archaeon]